MRVEVVELEYQPSARNSFFQGSKQELHQKLEDGFVKLLEYNDGENGYIIYRPARTVLKVYADGKVLQVLANEMICQYYGRPKMNKKLFKRFEKDLSASKVYIDYEDEKIDGIAIMKNSEMH